MVEGRRPRPTECPTVMESEVEEELPNVDYWAVPVPEETLTELEDSLFSPPTRKVLITDGLPENVSD